MHPAPRSSRPGGLTSIKRVKVIPVFGAGFGDVVVGFTKRTTRSSGGEPRVNASGVESVAAGEAADVIVVFEGVEADGAGVAWDCEEVWRGGCADWVVVFFVFVG